MDQVSYTKDLVFLIDIISLKKVMEVKFLPKEKKEIHLFKKVQ